jgi:hypothetical protein
MDPVGWPFIKLHEKNMLVKVNSYYEEGGVKP